MSSPEPTQVDTFDGTTPDIPSLSSLCVRAIDSLGTIPYDIVKPILEDKRCTPDILRKLELNSPHLKERDQEIWKRFFFEKYPEKLEPYSNGEFSVNSWRKLYTQYRLEEEEKLVQASARLRESKERGTAEKKGRQLQLTDKLPPAKRARFGDSPWGTLQKPKTLLEKARNQTKKASTMYRAPLSLSRASSTASSSSSTSSRPSPVSSLARPTGSSTSLSTKRVTQSHAHARQLHEYTSQLCSPPLARSPASHSTSQAASGGRSMATNRHTPSCPPTASPLAQQSSHSRPTPLHTSHSPPTSMADLVTSRGPLSLGNAGRLGNRF